MRFLCFITLFPCSLTTCLLTPLNITYILDIGPAGPSSHVFTWPSILCVTGGIPVNNTGIGNGTTGTPGFAPQQSAAATATGAATPPTTTAAQPNATAGVPATATAVGSDAGLMQPPRNPAPSTHHKKLGASTTPSSTGAAVATGDGNSNSPAGSTSRRRGPASTISSVAAVVAAVAGGGAGPGPPSSAVTGKIEQHFRTWKHLINYFFFFLN